MAFDQLELEVGNRVPEERVRQAGGLVVGAQALACGHQEQKVDDMAVQAAALVQPVHVRDDRLPVGAAEKQRFRGAHFVEGAGRGKQRFVVGAQRRVAFLGQRERVDEGLQIIGRVHIGSPCLFGLSSARLCTARGELLERPFSAADSSPF